MLSWPAAPTTAAQTADYVSDPAHPVPYVERPDRALTYTDDHWTAWLTSDQRNAASRHDVRTFTSAVLTKSVTIAGQLVVHLTASTSGTDSDWVVKLIDVYPDQVPLDHAMGGYQFATAGHFPWALPRKPGASASARVQCAAQI